MTITIKDLPQSTQYALLKEAKGRKERIKTFIDNLGSKYPAAKQALTDKGTEKKGDYDKLTGISSENDFRKFFNSFDGEQDIINLIKPEHIKQITAALTEQTADSDLLKELKATGRDQAGDIPDYYDNADGGITYGEFLSDLISNYYLKDAATYINKKLTDNDIKISELDKTEGAKAKTDLFNNVYSTFTKDWEESDLDPLIKGINEATDNIKNLIIKTRKARDDKKAQDLQDFLDLVGGTSLGVAKAWWTNTIRAFNEDFKDITGDKNKNFRKDELDKIKDELDARLKSINDKQAELNKVNQTNQDLKNAGTLATNRITTLENENDQLKKDLAAEKTKTPGTGTIPAIPTVAGTDEWKAVALFLTEPNIYKMKKIFSDLFYHNGTPAQRQAIYEYFGANKKNSHGARNKGPQHFIK